MLQPLLEWGIFYTIIGSVTGALIGLQFVVVTLVANKPNQYLEQAIAAFGTPTIVHFSAVLSLSALLSIPWHVSFFVAVFFAIIALSGMFYMWFVWRRVKEQTVFKLVREDWICHVLLPGLAYIILLLSAFLFPFFMHEILFSISGISLLLLFLGIHNAWDGIVTLLIEKAINRN